MPDTGVSRAVFLGTPEVAVEHLESLVAAGITVELVVTRPDVRRGRGSQVSPSPVKIAAQKLGISVSHDVSDVLNIAAQNPNLLGVVVAFGELIPIEVLSQVPMVNVHFSLLPRWRGAAPVERAILAGDEMTGVCIMRVVEKLDEGEVYARHEIAITDEDDVNSLRLKLNHVAIPLLMNIIKNGFDHGVAQTGEAIYAKKIKTADLQIDWSQSSKKILRQVRVGGAFTFANGRRIKILRGKPVTSVSRGFKSGQICEISKSSCCVATGDGAVSIVDLQPEGKSAMPFEEWLKGSRLNSDFLFGV